MKTVYVPAWQNPMFITSTCEGDFHMDFSAALYGATCMISVEPSAETSDDSIGLYCGI